MQLTRDGHDSPSEPPGGPTTEWRTTALRLDKTKFQVKGDDEGR
jgi:hypothetical protein